MKWRRRNNQKEITCHKKLIADIKKLAIEETKNQLKRKNGEREEDM